MSDTCLEPSNRDNRGPRWNRLTYQPKRVQTYPGEQKEAKRYDDLNVRIVMRGKK